MRPLRVQDHRPRRRGRRIILLLRPLCGGERRRRSARSSVRISRTELKGRLFGAILDAHLSRTCAVIGCLARWSERVNAFRQCVLASAIIASLPVSSDAAKPLFDFKRRAAIDLSGQAVDPLGETTNKAVVLIFVSRDCPISNRYAPTIRKLQSKFAPKGVKFWLVYPNADESAEAIRQHTNDYQLPCALVRDPQHALVKQARATVTPEAVVFLRGSKVVYRGRIDNRYVVLGKERPEATQHDLDAVLQAILDGKPVPGSQPAVGCYIAER
jgi:hypothetical protein